MKTIERQTRNLKSVFTEILMLFIIGSGALPLKAEKPGAMLIVQKKDGQTIKGELLTVRNEILNLLIYEDATKVDVRLDELSSIRIVKKSHALKGTWIGALAGAGIGALIGFASGDDKENGWLNLFNYTAGQKAVGLGGIIGFAGGIVGTIIGAVSGIDKLIQLDALAQEKLNQVEVKLASLARYKTNQVVKWKFIFTGPSNETHIITFFTRTEAGGNFNFPGISGLAGSYTTDGKNVAFLFPDRTDIQFSGQFPGKGTMIGTWGNKGETWNWTASRMTTIAEVEQTPVMQSKLFSNYRPVAVAEPVHVKLPVAKSTPPQVRKIPPLAVSPAAPSNRKAISRWHISFIPGIFRSQGGDKLSSTIKEAEFEAIANGKGWSETLSVDTAATNDSIHLFLLKDIKVEYSLTRRLALGFAYTPLGVCQIWGSRSNEWIVGSFKGDGIQRFLGGRFRGNSYFLTAAYMPLPDAFMKNWMLKLGAGIGYGAIKGAFLTALSPATSEREENDPYYQVKKWEFTRQVLSGVAFVELDYFFDRHLSFGLNVDYKYVPFRTDACQLEAPYTCSFTHASGTISINVPGLSTNAGGFGAGISIGFHF